MSAQYAAIDKAEQEDPVKRSIKKPDACAKFATIGKPKAVRVRPMAWKPSRRKKPRDKRDVRFY